MTKTRIAIPKGRLQKPILERLSRGGLSFNLKDPRSYNLHPFSPEIPFQGVLRKPRSIIQLLSLGKCDIGFCGLDLWRDDGTSMVVPVMDLKLNQIDVVVAVSKDNPDLLENPPVRPLVIATEYKNLAHYWAQNNGLAHIIIQTYGSTESYIPMDADIVIDCVETGRTMESNNLVILEKILTSSTFLFSSKKNLKDGKFTSDVLSLMQILKKGE